jgi:hypothetical protein
MRTHALVAILMVTLAATVSLARAQTMHVDIPASNLTAYASLDTTEGTYYSLSISIPGEVQTIRQAWLELRMDVDAPEVNGFRDPAPMFEVFMLKSELSGPLDEESFEPTRLPMARPVATGSGRRVRIDIADFVRKVIASPSANHGLVLGSVTGVVPRPSRSTRTDSGRVLWDVLPSFGRTAAWA